MSLFTPDLSCPSLKETDFETLKQRGTKLLMIDIDNTLVPWEADDVDEETRSLLASLAGSFRLALVSNRTAGRAEIIARSLDLPCVAPAMKPLPFRMRGLARKIGVSPYDSVLIGDQLLTDVLAARLGGFGSVLVEPFTEKEFIGTKFSRFIEQHVLGRRRTTG